MSTVSIDNVVDAVQCHAFKLHLPQYLYEYTSYFIYVMCKYRHTLHQNIYRKPVKPAGVR